MTAAPDHRDDPARKAALKAVQVGRRTLKIAEEDWRDLLERVTGGRSAAALGVLQLSLVRKELERLGWTPEAHGGGGRWRSKARHGHHRKVYALWGEVKRLGLWRVSSVDSLHAFCKRVAGVDHVEWLRPEQANKVVEALKKIADRAPGRASAAAEDDR